MAESCIVLWTNYAENDLDASIQYIAKSNVKYANDELKRIEKAADRLKVFPKKGRVVPELRVQGIHVFREIIMNPWRLIYRVQDSKIFILACIDERRHVGDILLERLFKG